jgi:hypothetical protein
MLIKNRIDIFWYMIIFISIICGIIYYTIPDSHCKAECEVMGVRHCEIGDFICYE